MIEPLLQGLCARLCRGQGRYATGCAAAAVAAPATAGDCPTPDPGPRSCGWFDSSHDLARGLRVQELATPEALAQALPLGSWLELELAACSR